MALHTIKINCTQHWIYAYDVEADSREEAESIALDMHLAGDESIDNWIVDEDAWIVGRKV